MITVTARDVVYNALKLINVLAAGEQLAANDAEDGFRRLNSLIDSWGVQPQSMFVSTRVELPLVANQQFYTIGLSGGADFGYERPIWVTHAGLYVPGSSPPVEIKVGELTRDAYSALQIKTLTNPLVSLYYYQDTVPDGTLFVYPIPTQDLTFILYYGITIAQFPDLTTQVTLATGYERALRYCLALELAPEFGVVQIHPLTVQHAADALADIKRANLTMVDLGMDRALTGFHGRPYNIFSDGRA